MREVWVRGNRYSAWVVLSQGEDTMKSVKKAGKVSQQPSSEDSESSGDAEILAQKRANLIERVENWRSDRDFGLYGLLDDVVVEIKLLRAERDTARREVCKSAGILRSVLDPNQEVDEWANYIARVNNWDCFKKEETQ
jgi:hypothetical protein